MDEKQFDKIIQVNIEDEMKTSYINYAMSVIVSRALPDVRDGLKPVHRRILYAMHELGLDPSKAYRKSARIVGDTMGKYHPHGNSSIYDALVRMAQDFSMRYMLVDGHGNFGSVDGDSAAAERYTEARLAKISLEMLSDIDKETVDFIPNYDDSDREPTVLPARFPNLLVNGSAGIAVGMATNIPPHNLTEVIDGVIRIINNHIDENRETDIEELIEIVKGPDFPTGATILGTAGIKEAFRTGRGKIRVRADATIEPMGNGRDMIAITELPYQVNKAKLIEKIAELVKEKKIEGISDLRDESDRTGMRVVVELKKDVNANVVLNQLYKFTQMQDNFGVIMLALHNNEPKVFNLKQMLGHYLDHQKEIITRRTIFDLKKARQRAHILEGLMIAIEHIDEVIAIIRSSKTTPESKERLIEKFSLSEEQATAIVDMRLRNLTGLEIDKLRQELAELMELIKELQAILDDENQLYRVIREELLVIKTKYGDERRTKIVFDYNDIDMEDLIEEGTNVITMTHMNYIKRLPLSTYKSQNRGGKGIIGMQTREEDFVENLFICSTHDYILFFTNQGRVYQTKAYEIPEVGRTAKGTPIVNLLELNGGEKIAAVIPVKEFDNDSYLLMFTKQGLIKKTYFKAYSNIRKGGLVAINIKDDDELISVKRSDGNKNILLVTSKGKGICFPEDEVRPVGRSAQGVKAITIKQDDRVVGAEVIEEGFKFLIVTQNGLGKCSELNEVKLQHRGGSGVKIHKINPKTGNIVGLTLVNDNEELIIVTSEGVVIRLRIKEISTTGRVSQGVKLINLAENVEVVSIAKIKEDYLDEEEEESLEEIEMTEQDAEENTQENAEE